MDNYKNLNKYTEYILKKNNLDISNKNGENVIEMISNYIDMLIYKYITYICYISINNKSKITNKDDYNIMIVILSKIKNKQKSKKIMNGGNMSSPEFLGKFEETYNINNLGEDLLNIDFNNEIARNAITGGDIDMKKYDKILLNYINSIFKYHNCKCNKEIKEKLLLSIKNNINDMIYKLKKMNVNLNNSNIKKICKKII